ncbi:hypothetical protein [Synechococcus sp. M16CYN]|uniref:hypothetical protein n=1 Tax=Synechococcus sp. M16CYN TaxID=3103139 RepID=UPI0030DF7E91
MGNPITPLASLCLGVVRGWINVARRGKGGQIDDHGAAWTRLPANQVRDQLAKEFQIEVSTRSVQRALKELEDAQHVIREQKWKHRYKRDYWYALPPDHRKDHDGLERRCPRTVAPTTYVSHRKTRSVSCEVTQVTPQILNTPISNTYLSSKPQRKTQIKQIEKPKTKSKERSKQKQNKPPLKTVKTCNVQAQGFRSEPINRLLNDWSGKIPNNPQWFKHRPEKPAGLDRQGRPQRWVWVGQVPHLVVD